MVRFSVEGEGFGRAEHVPEAAVGTLWRHPAGPRLDRTFTDEMGPRLDRA